MELRVERQGQSVDLFAKGDGHRRILEMSSDMRRHGDDGPMSPGDADEMFESAYFFVEMGSCRRCVQNENRSRDLFAEMSGGIDAFLKSLPRSAARRVTAAKPALVELSSLITPERFVTSESVDTCKLSSVTARSTLLNSNSAMRRSVGTRDSFVKHNVEHAISMVGQAPSNTTSRDTQNPRPSRRRVRTSSTAWRACRSTSSGRSPRARDAAVALERVPDHAASRPRSRAARGRRPLRRCVRRAGVRARHARA